MGISLSRRRAAAVRHRRRPGFAQLGPIGRRFQGALGRPAALTAQEDRDRAAGRHEFAAGDHGRRSPGDHGYLLRRVEQQPVLGGGLALPGGGGAGDVGPGGGEGWRWRRPGVHRHRLGGGGVLLLLPARAREQKREDQRGRGFHNVPWCTLRTLGSLRSRSSTSGGAGVSTLTSAMASPLRRSRASANWAMFTCASPRVRPTLPITPGLSLLCMTRMAPSGTASSSNLSTRTRRGSRLPPIVPETPVVTSLPQRRRTVVRLAKSGVSLVFTSCTERPRSRARAGAETSLTGSARNVPRTPLSTAAVSGALGCSATSPA